MALEHVLIAVDGTRERVGRDADFLRAEAHRAALARVVIALLVALRGIEPLRDECNDRMRRRAIELGAVRILESEHVTPVFDAGELHAETDAEVRNLVLARVANRGDLAFDAPLAEA